MKLRRFLGNLSSNVVLYFAAIIAVGIVLVNIVGMFTFQNLLNFNGFYEIIVILIMLIGIFFAIKYMSKIKEEKKFLLVLFVVGFILRMIWICFIKTEPFSDFAIIYDAANKMAAGNYGSVSEVPYFNLWVYQLGFSGYLAIFIKLFNNPLFIIKFMNVIIVSLIPIVIYYSTKLITSIKAAKIVAIAYCIYIGSIVNTSVLTNQHMATLLFYCGIYFILKNNKSRWNWLIIGIFLGFGEFFRPEGIIVVLAIVLFVVFKNIEDNKKLLKAIAEAVAAILTMVIIMQLMSFVFIKLGVTEYPLSNRDPLWKFTCGLNPETRGSYSVEDDAFISSFNGDRKEANLVLIKDRLSNPKELAVTMAYKSSVMWASDDTSLKFAFTENIDADELYKLVLKLEKIQYISIFILFAIGLLSLIRKKEKFLNSYLYLIVFLGYFCAHLLIEVQTRYRYFIIPAIFIIASYGIRQLNSEH